MKLAVGGLALILAMVTGPALAEYLEGVEYVAVANPQPVDTGDKIEVREVFMYSCPHCFHFEPTLNKWLKTLPPNAKFVRTPAIFRPTLEPQARAYYAFEALGATAKVHQAFFEAIHAHGQPMSDEDSIVKFAVEHGIKADDFRRMYHSFSMDADLKHAERLIAAFGIDSVPTLVVDGKYRTNGSMAGGSNEAMLQVVDYLIKKSAAERKAAGGKKPSHAK